MDGRFKAHARSGGFEASGYVRGGLRWSAGVAGGTGEGRKSYA